LVPLGFERTQGVFRSRADWEVVVEAILEHA
jgi:hypothetical protein